MFTSQENEYIRNLVISNLNNGYKNYICKTITERNNDYDFTCYFTKNDIVKSNNIYTIKNYTYYLIDTSSSYDVSNKNYSSTGDTYQLSINSNEFYYSNLEGFVDVVSDLNYDKVNNISYNIDLNYMYLIVLLLCMPIIIGFVHHFFRIK